MASETMMTGHVFISYVREDAARVDSLCRILNSAGIPVWRGTVSLWPGEDWRAKIRRAINGDTLVFLACFSRQGISRSRSYQNEELILAIDELRLHPPDQSWFIPVRFDDCQVPEREIGGGRMLTDLQQVDLFGEGYQQNVDRLIIAIKRSFEYNSALAITAGAVDDSGATVAAMPGPTAMQIRQRARYDVNLDRAQGVQIGDGNTQHNTFNGL